jgi:hypothetical protein
MTILISFVLIHLQKNGCLKLATISIKIVAPAR